MIEGHGDDAYRYEGITSDFSSNICLPAHRHEALMTHLANHPELILHYPEPEAWSLEKMLADRLGIDPACVIVTSGATDAIYLVAQTFPYRPVIPAPTFREYEDACKVVGNASERCNMPHAVTLGSATHYATPGSVTHYATLGSVTHYATLGSVIHYGESILWLCNPNNPTGEHYSSDSIRNMSAAHTLTVIDQSYEHYTAIPTMSAKTAVSRANVIQIHSMTKTYAVPGLRLGYIVAARPLTAALRCRLRPWSVSSLAIEAGKYLLQHDELMCRPDLEEARRLRALLSAIPGMTVSPSNTNFMLCRLPVVGNASERCVNLLTATLGSVAHYTAAALKDYLAREHKMLIRDASNFRGLTPQHFRVAAQSPAEDDALVAAIELFLKKQ